MLRHSVLDDGILPLDIEVNDLRESGRLEVALKMLNIMLRGREEQKDILNTALLQVTGECLHARVLREDGTEDDSHDIQRRVCVR